MRSLPTLIIALALLVAPLGAAQTSTDSDTLEADVQRDRAEITITNTTGDRNATVGILFDTNEGLLATNLTVDEGQEHQVNVNLHQLIEYEPGDEDGFDENATAISTWNVANESEDVAAESNGTLQWAPLQQDNVTADDGETEGLLVTGTALFQEEQPVPIETPEEMQDQLPPLDESNVTVEIAVFGQNATYNGVDVGPMQAAVNLTVNEYPYESDDSRLALVMEAGGVLQATDIQDGSLIASETVDNATVNLGLDWDEDALLDDEEASVDASTLEARDDAGASGDLIVLDYDQADRIEQHGTLGVSLEGADDGTDGVLTDDVPGPSLAAVLAGVAMLALARTRSR